MGLGAGKTEDDLVGVGKKSERRKDGESKRDQMETDRYWWRNVVTLAPGHFSGQEQHVGLAKARNS